MHKISVRRTLMVASLLLLFLAQPLMNVYSVPPKKDKPDTTDDTEKDKSKLREFEEPYLRDKEKTRDDKKKGKRKGKRKSTYEIESDDDDDEGGFWAEFLGELLLNILLDVSVGFIRLVGVNTIFYDCGYRYGDHPYSDFSPEGIYQVRILESGSEYHSAKAYTTQIRFFRQWVDKDINAWRLHGRLRGPSSVSLEATFTDYTERLAGRTIDLDYFSVFVNIAPFTEETNKLFDLGLGIATLKGVERHSSMAFKTSFDIFPDRPWGLHCSGEYSRPDKKSLYDLDGRVGLFLSGLEIIGGYHALINAGGDKLGGPYIGLTLWF